MFRLFVRHAVVDYEAWRKVYDGFDQERRSMGVVGDAVYQAVGDPTDVTVWHDFDTREAAQAFMTSDRLREAMTEAGVKGEPEIWIASGARARALASTSHSTNGRVGALRAPFKQPRLTHKWRAQSAI